MAGQSLPGRFRRPGAWTLLLALCGALLGAPALAETVSEQACQAARSSGVPRVRLDALARGFNLTSWTDAKEPRRPDPNALRGLFREGFMHVRLPVTLEFISPEFSSKGVMAKRRAELDRAVELLLGIGYAVSLDLHPGDAFNRIHKNDPDRGMRLIQTVWTDLAGHFRGRSPDRLFFEVLNEPEVARAPWNEQATQLVAAIRRAAPAHTIIVGPAYFQRIEALETFRPMEDRNVVYAVHFYDPMAFTHQGMTWADDSEPLKHLHGVPFPLDKSDPTVEALRAELVGAGRGEAARELMKQAAEPSSERSIDASFERVAAWVVRHGRPVIVNEFGVLGFEASEAHRIRWLTAVRRAAERACIGWTHWEYADGFGFMQRTGDGRETPKTPLLRALIEPRR